MIMSILELRARLRDFYQKYQVVINPVIKFFIGFIVFTQINGNIGYDSRFDKTSLVLLLSMLSAFTPIAIMVFAAMVLMLIHVYYISSFMAILLLLVFIVLYCLFLRFTPKFGIVVILVPLLSTFHMAYAVPLLLGLIATPLTILPVSCGVFVYFLFDVIKDVAAKQVQMSMDDILQFYTDVADDVISNKEMLLTIVVFALVIAVVYTVRKIQFEYAFEIALAAGAVVNFLGLLIGYLKFDLSSSILGLFLMTIVSGAIVLIIHFFHRVLDYSAVERVQFEDDNYYYYVKAVPKIDVTLPDRNIKHINTKNRNRVEDEDYEDYSSEDDFYESVKSKPRKGRPRRASAVRGSKGRMLTEEEMQLDERYAIDTPKQKRSFSQYDMDEDGYELDMTLEDDDR